MRWLRQGALLSHRTRRGAQRDAILDRPGDKKVDVRHTPSPIIYETEKSFGGPWHLDRSQLESLDRLLDGEIDKLLASFPGSEINRKTTVRLKGGGRIEREAFTEIGLIPDLSGQIANAFTVSISGPIVCEIQLRMDQVTTISNGNQSTTSYPKLRLSVSPDSKHEAGALYMRLLQWVEDNGPSRLESARRNMPIPATLTSALALGLAASAFGLIVEEDGSHLPPAVGPVLLALAVVAALFCVPPPAIIIGVGTGQRRIVAWRKWGRFVLTTIPGLIAATLAGQLIITLLP